MLNAKEIYEKLKDGNPVFAFNGEVTNQFIDSVFKKMDLRETENGDNFRLNKKVNNIIIECLQNLHHHSKHLAPLKKREPSSQAVFLVYRTANGYQVISGNQMFSADVPGLKAKIDKINSMTEQELKKYYQESLRDSELSAKGGAGLGIIHMARQSGNKIEYRFDRISEERTYFSMQLNVN